MNRLMAAMLALSMLAGCSTQPPGSKPAEEKPPAPRQAEQISGRSAFQKLYVSARMWAPDARPYRLESEWSPDSTGKEGKAAIWRGSFASASRRSIRAYVWSGSSSPDAPSAGISPGVEDTYNPSNSSTQVFDMQFLRVDSDKAFAVAQQHGGEKLMAKNPNQAVFYILEWNPGANQLVWHVIYGTSRAEAQLRIAVDASSGDYLRTEK